MEFLPYFPIVGAATGLVLAFLAYDTKWWRFLLAWLLLIILSVLVLWLMWLAIAPGPVNFDNFLRVLVTAYRATDGLVAVTRTYYLLAVMTFLCAWVIRLVWVWSRQQNAPS